MPANGLSFTVMVTDIVGGSIGVEKIGVVTLGAAIVSETDALVRPAMQTISPAFTSLTGTRDVPSNRRSFVRRPTSTCFPSKLMARTAKRPLVTGVLNKVQATVFATIVAILSLVIFWVFTTPLATLLTLIAIVFYVVVYTMGLKRRTAQNIVWGGAAGCMPVFIGWAAVTNSLSWTAVAFFMVIFFWTPPHFWALAIARRDEYAKAGIPMLPVTHGIPNTRLQVLLYTVLLVLVTLMPYLTRMSGLIYLAAAIILNARFLYYAFALKMTERTELPMKVFRFSISYLMYLFAALLIDHYIITTQLQPLG